MSSSLPRPRAETQRTSSLNNIRKSISYEPTSPAWLQMPRAPGLGLLDEFVPRGLRSTPLLPPAVPIARFRAYRSGIRQCRHSKTKERRLQRQLRAEGAWRSRCHGPYRSPCRCKLKRYAPYSPICLKTYDQRPGYRFSQLAKGADVLVSEATNPVDEYRDAQIKQGSWQARTPEEQTDLIRHHIEEHLLPDDHGKMAAAAGVKMVV